jgi:hypothetical protein
MKGRISDNIQGEEAFSGTIKRKLLLFILTIAFGTNFENILRLSIFYIKRLIFRRWRKLNAFGDGNRVIFYIVLLEALLTHVGLRVYRN